MICLMCSVSDTNNSNNQGMQQREALLHVLLVCEQYQNRVQWEIVAPIVIDSLHRDGRTSVELHDFLHERVKSKTIHEFLPYVKAYHDRQKALAQHFKDLKNRAEGVRPDAKLVQPRFPRAKGILKG